MNSEFGMYQGYNVESKSMEMSAQSKMQEMPMTGGMSCGCQQPECCPTVCPGVVCPPVYECPTERCVHRQFVHEIPHVLPVNTKIINHHVYKHTFSPCYTCCEENVVTNVNPCCPGMF